MIAKIGAAGSRMDEMSPRGLVLRVQNGGLTTQDDTEERRESCLISPIFDRNLSLQRGKSFNFISFYVFFLCSETIQVDPGRSDSDWRYELIRSDFCTCLFTDSPPRVISIPSMA